MINVLSKPVTPHYLPKVQEYVLAKPHHVIAPGSSRNSQEEPYGSSVMAHNHYLEEARKKTQERYRNSRPSVMHTTSLQNTANGSKPNPRSNNQISRSLPVSKSSCGMSPGSSRNSQEEPYGSSVMAHNHYLEEARKKTQERNRNSRPSMMHTTSLQNTANGSKPNPRSNNQISMSLLVSKSSCGMSNGVSL
ncbi:hypothetical protein Tco_1126829, partial [Tanacetum coccineum]